MTDADLWNYLEQYAKIQPLWWFTSIVTLAMLEAVCAYLLMWFTLARNKAHLTTMLFWLLVSSLPALLIMPSLYARWAIGDALLHIGVARPRVVQDLAFATALQVGADLSLVAWLGLSGALIALAMMFGCLFQGRFHYISPLQRRTENAASRVEANPPAISGVNTELFDAQASSGSVSARYGVIRVLNGQRGGTKFGIISDIIIGKQKADLTINDPIVSRHHARLDIRHNVVYLTDLNSRNGTYLNRPGVGERLVTSDPCELQANDVIFLGNPQLKEAVQLIYERSTPESTTVIHFEDL